MIFQWHINENCNLRCKHCYQDNYQDEGLTLDKLTGILNKIETFILYLDKNSKSNIKAHINFTGGEPFLKKELIALLKEVKFRKLFSFAILSNGLLLEHSGLMELKASQPVFIQISLDGNRKINDAIRGKGSYDAIIKALETYRKLKIPTMISFTANASNYQSFPDVLRIARKYNAIKIWTDRYIPTDANDILRMNSDQFKEFLEIIAKAQRKNKFYIFSKTKVATNRALQFLNFGGQPYKCSAGDQLIAILPNGDVLPCRRLPVKIGNILTEDLINIFNHPGIKNIHCNESLPKDCINCYYTETCHGGLKCLTYALNENFNSKDPDCWI